MTWNPSALTFTLTALCMLSPTPGAASPADDHERVYADPSAFGPYEVGVTSLQVRARHHRGESLNTLIWYPADVSPGSQPYVYLDDPIVGALSFTAVEDAPIVRGPEPYPVIAFSHGNGGIAYQSAFLTEHLASHGYVVISADHPGNTLFEYEPTSLVTGFITRPQDISALLDELERLNQKTGSMFRGQLDMGLVGMTGHSFGGYTTLAVAGAELNANFARRQCRVTGDFDACRMVMELSQLGVGPDGYIDLSDPRVDAAVPLAPLGWDPFREGGLAKLTAPLQVQGGGLDDTCPLETQVEPVYTYVSGPRSLLNFPDAGHYAWSDLCELQPDFEECAPPYIDIDLVHGLISTWTTSHFKVFLEGDSRYEVYLTDDYAALYQGLLTFEQDLDL